MNHTKITDPSRYSAAMLWLHWLCAGVVMVTLAIGIIMVNLPHVLLAKFDVPYPHHKQFGLLELLLVAVALIVGAGSNVPNLLPVWRHGRVRTPDS